MVSADGRQSGSGPRQGEAAADERGALRGEGLGTARVGQEARRCHEGVMTGVLVMVLLPSCVVAVGGYNMCICTCTHDGRRPGTDTQAFLRWCRGGLKFR